MVGTSPKEYFFLSLHPTQGTVLYHTKIKCNYMRDWHYESELLSLLTPHSCLLTSHKQISPQHCNSDIATGSEVEISGLLCLSIPRTETRINL